jgi:hypothetical protein
MMRRALAIVEAAFGNDHPNAAANLNNLALLLMSSNRLAEAELLMLRNFVILLNFTVKSTSALGDGV